MEVSVATKLPAAVGPDIVRASIFDRFDVYEASFVGELSWEALPYGVCRDVVLLRSPRGVVTEAAVCDNVHCEGGVYPRHTRVPLDKLAGVLLSYPLSGAVFSARRREIHFPKKVSHPARGSDCIGTDTRPCNLQVVVKILGGLVSGGVDVAAEELRWPPLHQAFRQMGGGHWTHHAGMLKVDFAHGGFVGFHFVKRRQCSLDRGQLAVPISTAVSELPALVKRWVSKMLAHPLAASLAAGDLSSVPHATKGFFKGRLRKRQRVILERSNDAPRCVKLALAMPATGPTPRAWKYPMRWDVAKVLRAYAALVGRPVADVVNEAVVPAMRARGDAESAIAEFVGHTRSGGTKGFACHRRTKAAGLFCPITPQACAAERGIPCGPHMTPALVWASARVDQTPPSAAGTIAATK